MASAGAGVFGSFVDANVSTNVSTGGSPLCPNAETQLGHYYRLRIGDLI